MEILKITRDLEVNELLLQVLDDKWVAPKQSEVGGR